MLSEVYSSISCFMASAGAVLNIAVLAEIAVQLSNEFHLLCKNYSLKLIGLLDKSNGLSNGDFHTGMSFDLVESWD